MDNSSAVSRMDSEMGSRASRNRTQNSSASGQFLRPYHSWQPSEHLSWEFWAKSHHTCPTQRPRDNPLLQSSLPGQVYPSGNWSLWWRHKPCSNLQYQSAPGNVACRPCLAQSQHNNDPKLLVQSWNFTFGHRQPLPIWYRLTAIDFNPHLFTAQWSFPGNGPHCSCGEASQDCTWWFGSNRHTAEIKLNGSWIAP